MPDSRALSVAVICFLPDLGHLLPMLKAADALRERGHDVTCFAPPDCAGAASRYPFTFVPLVSPDLAEAKKVLARTFARSLFFNAFTGYAHINLHQTGKVVRAAGASAASLVEALEALGPDLIIADSYLLGDWYRTLAEIVGAPLLLHNAGGSLAHRQEPYVRVYGGPDRPRLLRGAVTAIGAVSTAVCGRGFRLAQPRLWAAARRDKAEGLRLFARATAGRPRTPVPVRTISTGTCVLERRHLGDRLRIDGGGVDYFPPSRIRSPQELPRALADWLPGPGEPAAVYVSFGSIVQIDDRFTAAVYEGLRRTGRKVVWSLPENQRGGLSGVTLTDRIRIERFVPQPELLAHPAIGGFVTQGGSSSVQEALLGGTPLLCVPFFTDQGYNGWLVETLGLGRRLWRTRVTPGRIRDAVLALLETPSYQARAEALRQEVAAPDGGDLLADYAEALAIPSAEPASTSFSPSAPERTNASFGGVARS